jgi:hypothetical protein
MEALKVKVDFKKPSSCSIPESSKICLLHNDYKYPFRLKKRDIIQLQTFVEVNEFLLTCKIILTEAEGWGQYWFCRSIINCILLHNDYKYPYFS